MTELEETLYKIGYYSMSLRTLGYSIFAATCELGALDDVASGYDCLFEALADNLEALSTKSKELLAQSLEKTPDGNQEPPAWLLPLYRFLKQYKGDRNKAWDALAKHLPTQIPFPTQQEAAPYIEKLSANM